MSPPRPWPVRVFGRLVRLLPPEDRREFGARLVEDVARGYRERRSRDRRAALRWLAGEAWDLIGNAVAARARTLSPSLGGGSSMEGLWYDVRIAARALARSPVLVLGAVTTLGVGIGVNVALSSLVYSALLRPLPFEEPDRLASLYMTWDDRDLGATWVGIDLLSREAESVGSIAGAILPGMDDRLVLDGPTGSDVVEGLRVSPNFFSVLGATPRYGPGVSADGPFDAIEPSLLLSHASWTRRFGADPDIVGRTLTVHGRAHRVAGVMPPGFSFRLGPEPPEFYVARTLTEEERTWTDGVVIRPVVRLAPGASLEDLQRELGRLAPRLDQLRETSARGRDLEARSLREELVGDLSRPLGALALAAVLVLLVACANLATLFLARHSQREAEHAVRLAMGAGRGRLARTPLLEAVLLGVGGGVVGLALAKGATGAVTRFAPGAMAAYPGLQLGPVVLGVTVLLAIGAGLACGGLPALAAGRTGPAQVLRRVGGRGTSGAARATRVLVGAEAAALVVLLVSTGLSLRSLDSLLDVDLGFETRDRATALLIVPEDRTESLEDFGGFLLEIEETVRALPEVSAAGTVTHLPLDPDSWGGTLTVEGRESEAGEVATEWELASPGYFEAAGIELLQGRVFEPSDGPSSPTVTVVSRSLAETIRPDGRVLGMRISGTGPEGPWMQVVGVVEDVRQRSLGGGDRPYMYVAHAQLFAFPERALVVEASGGEPMRALGAARDALSRLDPDLVLTQPRPLADLVERATGTPRLVTALLGAFGGASLLLALAGIYGITAFAAARRRRELGIRACLGAPRRALLLRSLGASLVPVAVGAAGGLLAVVAVAPRVEGLLHGVSPLDPLTLATVPALLLVAAALTALGPAYGASGTDPAQVIREE